MKIIYIHGANATPNSFNYIRSKLPGYQEILVEYDSALGFYRNIQNIKKSIAKEKCYIIAHSLGGIYALHLSNYLQNHLTGCTTIGTPYGGSEIAVGLKYIFPAYKLFWDITPNSRPIRTGKNIKINSPWQQLITTGKGFPWLMRPNDGVVTIDSMTSRKDIQQHVLSTGHYETLLDDNTVLFVKKHIEWCS